MNRNGRVGHLIDSARQDFKYAVRSLVHHPLSTTLVLLVLALGIGGTTAIFTLLNALLLKPLPYTDSERLVTVLDSFDRVGVVNIPPTVPEVIDIQARASAFDKVAFLDFRDLQIYSGTEPYRVFASRATAPFFSLLGVNAAIGRTFADKDGTTGFDNVLILSDAFWRRAFAADPSAVGKNVLINGSPYTVIGVLPPTFSFDHPGLNIPERIDLFIPFPMNNTYMSRSSPFVNERRVRTLARLKPGYDATRATSELAIVAQQLVAEHPELYRRGSSDFGFRLGVQPLQQAIVGRSGAILSVTFAAVGLVLLIACANTVQFILARSLERSHEVAVRTAVGATPGRLARQFVTETLVLGLAGGALGLGVAGLIVRLVVRTAPSYDPLLAGARADVRVLAFTLGIALLTTALIAVLPAVQASRSSRAQTSLRGTLRGSNRVRYALLAGEVGLSMVLLVAAGVLVRGLVELQTRPRGFSSKNVAVMQLRLPPQRAQASPIASVIYHRYVQAIAAVSGVEAAAVASGPPVHIMESRFRLEGADDDAAALSRQSAAFHIITPGYFNTLRIPLLEGREFADTDTRDRPPVAIISQEMARRFWPGSSPIGKRLQLARLTEIVGVVGDARMSARQADVVPQLYVPALQLFEPNAYVVFRASRDPLTLVNDIKRAITAVVPDQPVFNVHSLDDLLWTSMAEQRFNALLISTFSLLAAFMSVAGLFSVMSYVVSQRTREIAVCMALGARRAQLCRLVAAQTLAWVIAGVAVGVAGGIAASRLMSGFVAVLVPPSAVTFGAAVMFYLIVASLAVVLPLYRALRLEPMTALRIE